MLGSCKERRGVKGGEERRTAHSVGRLVTSRRRRRRNRSKEKRDFLSIERLTDCGGVAGAERGVRGQRGGALRPGQGCSGRRAGVGGLGRAERPYLSEGRHERYCGTRQGLKNMDVVSVTSLVGF